MYVILFVVVAQFLMANIHFAVEHKRLSDSTAEAPDASFYTSRRIHKRLTEQYENKSEITEATNCSVIRDAESLCSTCEQVCHYVPTVSPPRVKCGCYRGYAIGRDWQHCIDIDECSINPWLCHEGTCLNTVGSYVCRCRSGYQLIGHVCVDIDECSRNKQICHQLCFNVPGSYQCWCHNGFALSHTNPGSCVDIDECDSTVCSHSCINTVGSFSCTCPHNLTLRADGRTCMLEGETAISSKDIIIDGSHKIVIYGNSNSTRLYEEDSSVLSRGEEWSLSNTSAAFSSQPEILTVNINKTHKYRACIPACKNSGICDGRGKCHCRSGFQGRYCQIDVNECSAQPSVCSYMCVNMFGSYQCICPYGYNISADRKSCLLHRHNYSAVIQVVVRPEVSPSEVDFFHTQPSQGKLFDNTNPSRVEPFATNPIRIKPFDTNPNQVKPFDTNPSRVKPFATNPIRIKPFDTNPNQVKPFDTNPSRVKPFDTQLRYQLHSKLAIGNLHTAISSSLESELPTAELKPTAAVQRDLTIVPSGSEFIMTSQTPVAEFIEPTSVSEDVVVPTLTEDTGKILDTLFSFILGTDQLYLETSRRAYFEPTSSVLLDGSKISPTSVVSDVTVASSTHASRFNSKKERKIKGKKTKRLEQKKRLKNKTLRKGRLKLVRLTKDYEVVRQILDASRDSWRTEGSSVQQRVLGEDTTGDLDTEDRYFEVMDYDEDMLVPVPLTVWDQSRKQEANCSYRNQVITSRSSVYQDDKNCTRCLCRDGEMQCKPHHCPIPQCEAPLHGECCDYCPDDCVIDNNVYLSGERFTPAVDPCRECRCKLGRAVCEDVQCRKVDCPKQEQVYVSNGCCPACLPLESGCHYRGRFFYQGQLWVRKEGGCQACLCRDGEVQCNPVVCVVDCQHPQFIPGECCPLCEGCQHYNHKYSNEEVFPHPSDTCSLCHCQQGNITCYPKPCNTSCSHPYKPAGECCAVCRHCYFNRRKISNGASLVINNGTCQQCTCKQGNVTCQPSACAADCMIHGKPVPSGAEFHIGSDMCTQCRCWNGSVSCQAVECHDICSHGVLLPHKCCLDCTKCDFQGELYSEMQVFRLKHDKCKSCLCVKGNVMCQDTCRPKH